MHNRSGEPISSPIGYVHLDLRAGDRVLEIGAGPGFVSFALANRVAPAPAGIVYAVDRSTEALAHLERRQKDRGV